MNNIQKTIKDALLTKHHASECVQMIDDIIDSLYNKKSKPQKQLSSTLPYRQYALLEDFLKENKIKMSQKKQLAKGLALFKKEIQNIPVIDIDLAYNPPQDHVIQMSEIIERELFGPVLLNIHVRPEIIGGAILRYKGKFKDYSVQSRLTT